MMGNGCDFESLLSHDPGVRRFIEFEGGATNAGDLHRADSAVIGCRLFKAIQSQMRHGVSYSVRVV